MPAIKPILRIPLALLLPPLAAMHATDSPKAAARPNLVAFLVDDSRLDCLGVPGHPMVKMTYLAEKPEFAGRIKELTPLLPKTRQEYGDTAPLAVANPKPSAWTPPDGGTKKATKHTAKKREKRNQ